MSYGLIWYIFASWNQKQSGPQHWKFRCCKVKEHNCHRSHLELKQVQSVVRKELGWPCHCWCDGLSTLAPSEGSWGGLIQIFALFWLHYRALSHVLGVSWGESYVKISALGAIFGVLCAWLALSELGENRMAYSCSCRCSLVRGIASRMCHGSWDGGRDDRSSLRLLPAASFVNAWAVLFTCQYFLIAHSSHDSWWSYCWWQQSGGIPAPSENWYRGERWGNGRVLLLALNTEWPRDAFTSMKITEEKGVKCLETTTPERNKENEWCCWRVWILRFLTSPAK